MQQCTKAIIIILGAIILFALLIATIFDLFPSKKQEVSLEQETEVILPDKSQGLPENKVFDSSNAREFSDLNPFVFSDEDISPLEKEAKELAEFFIERFGTYSSDASGANIDDLVGFMTEAMQKDIQKYKQSIPKRDSFYSVVSELSGTQTNSFSLATRSASFDIVLNRTEESGNNIDQYNQEVEVALKQDSTGLWKVNNVIWGKKL